MTDLEPGDRVRHPGMAAEWGLGEVLEVHGEELLVFFVEVGEKTLSTRHVILERVPATEAQHPLLDNLPRGSRGVLKTYRSFTQSKERFLELFPKGFQDQRYLDEERDDKVAAHELAMELLGTDALASLITSGEHEDVCRRALQVVNKTNLMFPQEKTALRDGLEAPEAQEAFTTVLQDTLYGDGDPQARFEALAKMLTGIGADKWATITYLPFLLDPAHQMFVKPQVTKNAAEITRFDIAYEPKPNWTTYSRVLEFARYLAEVLEGQGQHELEPRDMIDIQSFIWCIDPGRG